MSRVAHTVHGWIRNGWPQDEWHDYNYILAIRYNRRFQSVDVMPKPNPRAPLLTAPEGQVALADHGASPPSSWGHEAAAPAIPVSSNAAIFNGRFALITNYV